MRSDQSIDVCITFDTTGSMYPCLTQVREEVQNTVKRLFKDIPDLRVAIIAHGDYCDKNRSYVTNILDFSTNPDTICKFVKSVKATGGGDWPECYELVLHEARTKLNWQSGRAKVVTMIGDAIPHEPSYPDNTMNLDWRNEAGLLSESGITIYAVQALPTSDRTTKRFYEQLADISDGLYLTLDQFEDVNELIMGVCYKQKSNEALKNYIVEVEKSGRLSRDLNISFKVMLGEERSKAVRSTAKKRKTSLKNVPGGRFQAFTVKKDQDIRSFVKGKGAKFKLGRGFYELSNKSVKVQRHKEILLQDKDTGEIFQGPEVRKMLGLLSEKKGDSTVETLKPTYLDDYRVFIQSTSSNRKLLKNTKFMYEVEDWRS